jgi:hypothetical protein
VSQSINKANSARLRKGPGLPGGRNRRGACKCPYQLRGRCQRRHAALQPMFYVRCDDGRQQPMHATLHLVKFSVRSLGMWRSQGIGSISVYQNNNKDRKNEVIYEFETGVHTRRWPGEEKSQKRFCHASRFWRGIFNLRARQLETRKLLQKGILLHRADEDGMR